MSKKENAGFIIDCTACLTRKIGGCLFSRKATTKVLACPDYVFMGDTEEITHEMWDGILPQIM